MKLPDANNVGCVAIVGAGTIGASWAAHFLGRGMNVRVWDPAPDTARRVRRSIDDAWPVLEQLGLAEGASPDRLVLCRELDDALDGVEFVQESAPESKTLKIEIYKRFDSALPSETIMSTSSSGLLLTELQAGRMGRERYVLGHPFNPPHLIPLVEVLGGAETAPSVVDWTVDFYNAHGKRAIRLNKEVPGHLVNRLQAALWREAIDAVTSGLASVEDVDTAIAYGPGLRWSLMGPHQIFQLAGGSGGMPNFLEHFGPGIEAWWRNMRDVTLTTEVKSMLIEGVQEEARGRTIEELSKERDRLLVELVKLLGRAPGNLQVR